MTYLDRLKALDSEKCPPSLPQKLQKDPSYSFCSTQGGRFQEIAPPEQAKPSPARNCSICAHRLPGWHSLQAAPCGNPVAAGLSDLEGVIRYSPDQGATCPAWLATLPGDLERRILAMSERWGYSGDDLRRALDGARSDPEGWRRVVDSDEGGRKAMEYQGGLYGDEAEAQVGLATEGLGWSDATLRPTHAWRTWP